MKHPQDKNADHASASRQEERVLVTRAKAPLRDKIERNGGVHAEPRQGRDRAGNRAIGRAAAGRPEGGTVTARSAECPCGAVPAVPCGPAGDHLARYLRAEQDGLITRESLKETIVGLDIIASHVLIQPPDGRAARAAGAETAGLCAREARELEAGA